MRIFSKTTGVIALAALSLIAQQPQAPAPAAAAPPARTASASDKPLVSIGTSLVTLDVTVKDKSGKPIEGLKQSDFQVSEDGKVQKVSVFEAQKLTMEPEPPPALTLSDQLKLPEAPKTVITVESPGKVQYHDKRLLAFYFDFSTMQIAEQVRSQDAALEFLDKKITKDDVVAVFFYASQVQILSDFTGDRELLRTTIKQLPIGEASELAALADSGGCSEEDTGAAFVGDESEFNVFNTDQKLYALEKVAKILSALPEKKELIYFNGGISKTGVDNQAQLEATVNAATKANLLLFPVDARGLMADPPGGGASKGGSRGSGIFTGANYNSQRQSINDSQETLSTLAADTGGKVFLDSNDIEAGIEQAQRAMQSYYIMGYYTSNGAMDGKFRTIQVKLTNGMSATLEYRKGYYANKVWTKLNSSDKDQQLKEALAAGDPITDIPIAPQVDFFRVGPSTYFVPVSAKIPGGVIDLKSKGNASTTAFDFVVEIEDETHTTVGNVTDLIKVKLDSEAAEKASQKSYQYDTGFTLEPGRYRMKILVREDLSGKMGTFDQRFTIPDLAADTSGLKLSSIIWSNQREPLTAAVGAAQRLNRRDVASDPRIVGDEKIVPNVTKVFRRNQNMFVTFDVYDAAPDPVNSKLRDVKVSLSLFNQKGAKAFEVGPIEAKQTATTRPEAVPVNIQIPLKDIVPGRYRCQINVVDEAGRKFAFPSADLVVFP
jgi:VWFA-related protein